jgi:type II secretory pathway component GspD/PulD (secretin)
MTNRTCHRGISLLWCFVLTSLTSSVASADVVTLTSGSVERDTIVAASAGSGSKTGKDIDAREALGRINLNTAIVRRVEPEDLDHYQPQELVKVLFRLDWMEAVKAAEEFKPLLSSQGKLRALKWTNRIEAIDTAQNLKQLAIAIEKKQGARGEKSPVMMEFKLRYTKADETLRQLQRFLDSKKETMDAPQKVQKAPMPMKSGQQALQPGQLPGGGLPETPARPEVRLMANTHRNTILVSASGNRMAIIKAAIKKIDVLPKGVPSPTTGRRIGPRPLTK